MASNQSPPIHKRIWVTSSETIVCETRAVEILKRYLKKDSELTSILHPIQRESYTYHYVSGTRRCTEKLQRSIEDSVAHRILAGTIDDIVAGISEDLQTPVLDIGLYCHRLCDKSNSYKKEKKGDVIKHMKDDSYYSGLPIDYEIYFKRNTYTESPDSSECQGTGKTIKVQVNPSHFDPFFPSGSIPDDVKTAVQKCWPRYTVILIN